MKRFGIYIFLVLNVSLIYAQTDPDYIQDYSHRFDITAYVGWDFLDVNEKNINYKPNNPVKLGLSFSLNNLSSNSMLLFGGGINITDRANQDLPKTTSYDFQLHSYSRKLMIDLYLQNYKGFYTGELPDIISHPDMSIMKIGAEAGYIFNNEKFSARAAFTQTQRQLKSAGSLILGGGSYFFRLDKGEQDLNLIQIGVNLGYVYTFVITKNIFISPALTGGIFYSSQVNPWQAKEASASFNGVGRLSAGYNTDRWCASILVLYKLHYFNSDLIFNTGSFQMAFTYRFDNIFKRK